MFYTAGDYLRVCAFTYIKSSLWQLLGYTQMSLLFVLITIKRMAKWGRLHRSWDLSCEIWFEIRDLSSEILDLRAGIRDLRSEIGGLSALAALLWASALCLTSLRDGCMCAHFFLSYIKSNLQQLFWATPKCFCSSWTLDIEVKKQENRQWESHCHPLCGRIHMVSVTLLPLTVLQDCLSYMSTRVMLAQLIYNMQDVSGRTCNREIDRAMLVY